MKGRLNSYGRERVWRYGAASQLLTRAKLSYRCTRVQSVFSYGRPSIAVELFSLLESDVPLGSGLILFRVAAPAREGLRDHLGLAFVACLILDLDCDDSDAGNFLPRRTSRIRNASLG